MPRSQSSFWHSTCAAIRTGLDPTWAEVSDYREPLLLLLRMRYDWLPPEEREDLVHDILVDLRGGLARRYRPDRGPFRAYLRGVVQRKVIDRWREARRRCSLDAVDEPIAVPGEDGAAIDLVAEVCGAVRRWHDARCAGGPGEQRRVYVVAGRLVRAEPYDAIAAREGISRDAVKRILSKAREEIVADLLRHALGLDEEEKAGLDFPRLATIAREALARPVARERVLARVARATVREALAAWLRSYEAALESLAGAGNQSAAELRRGLEEILERDEGPDG